VLYLLGGIIAFFEYSRREATEVSLSRGLHLTGVPLDGQPPRCSGEREREREEEEWWVPEESICQLKNFTWQRAALHSRRKKKKSLAVWPESGANKGNTDLQRFIILLGRFS